MRCNYIVATLLLTLFAVCFVFEPALADHPWDIDTGGHESTTNSIGGEDGDNKESIGVSQADSSPSVEGSWILKSAYPLSWLALKYVVSHYGIVSDTEPDVQTASERSVRYSPERWQH